MQRKKTVGIYTIFLHCFDNEYDVRVYYYYKNGRVKTNEFIFTCADIAQQFFNMFWGDYYENIKKDG